MKRLILIKILLLWQQLPTTTLAFVVPSSSEKSALTRQQSAPPPLYAFRPLSSVLRRIRPTTNAPPVPLVEPQKSAEELEWEEEDFLLAEVKPAVLNHERDFFRQSTRIQAWDEYVLVSILCTSISYNALQNFALNADHEGIYFYETVVRTAIQIVAGLAVLSGLYATMVFSLSILYLKTALGAERDPQYDRFLDNTLDIRIQGFRAFSLALAMFAVLVVLVLSETLPLVMHLPVGAVMLGALYVGFRDWKILVDNATPIYKDDD